MEAIQNITVGEIVKWCAAVIGALSLLVEFSKKIKIKPWTWIARHIGTAINGEVISRLTVVEAQLDELKEHDVRQDAERAEDNAVESRRRILQFADEIRRRVRHSQEHFNQIFEDIKYYKDYCDSHPRFQNDKAVRSIKIIEETFEECQKDDSFL